VKYNQFSSRRRIVDRKLAWFREAGNIYPQSLAYFPAFNEKINHEYNEEEWNMKSEVLFTIQKYYPVPNVFNRNGTVMLKIQANFISYKRNMNTRYSGRNIKAPPPPSYK